MSGSVRSTVDDSRVRDRVTGRVAGNTRPRVSAPLTRLGDGRVRVGWPVTAGHPSRRLRRGCGVVGGGVVEDEVVEAGVEGFGDAGEGIE